MHIHIHMQLATIHDGMTLSTA